MREGVGDLWKYPAHYRAFLTNGIVTKDGLLVMGAGVALQAKQRFPGLPAALGRLVKLHGNRPFVMEAECLISFPTKHNWREKSDIELIRRSAVKVVGLVDRMRARSVAMPRPGCGLGNLDWDDVKKVLSPILDDRFVVLTPEAQ
jgi:O-acetyl-ADP-ribose deacetylase (regulator of RNase III)